MKFIKPKLWKGNDLKGCWLITYKIDGVRMLRDEDGKPVSRSGKPLYNLDHVSKGVTDAEIFYTDWESSVSLVRTKDAEPVKRDHVYPLNMHDPRLIVGVFDSPIKEHISAELVKATDRGYEGLVLIQGDVQLKVKPKETYDVEVLGMVEGTGKYVGMLGALETSMGKVGTGFTDEDRRNFYTAGVIVGSTVEVDCMSLTKSGKFRHPRFIRVRWDK